MCNYPIVSCSFILCGASLKDKKLLESLSEIGAGELTLSESRRAPQFSCDEWCISVKKDSCSCVSCCSTELISMLLEKAGLIQSIAHRWNLNAILLIHVNTIDDEMPELIFDKKLVHFASLVEAEIHFALG